MLLPLCEGERLVMPVEVRRGSVGAGERERRSDPMVEARAAQSLEEANAEFWEVRSGVTIKIYALLHC